MRLDKQVIDALNSRGMAEFEIVCYDRKQHWDVGIRGPLIDMANNLALVVATFHKYGIAKYSGAHGYPYDISLLVAKTHESIVKGNGQRLLNQIRMMHYSLIRPVLLAKPAMLIPTEVGEKIVPQEPAGRKPEPSFAGSVP